MFLPESTGQQPVAGVTNVTPANPESTTEDVALMQRVLSAAARNPNLIPDDFMAYVLDYIQVGRIQIPIGQVFGYKRTTAVSSFVATQETRTSSTFGDLATVGPKLDGLGAGSFLVLWGCGAAGNPAVSNAEMVIQDGSGNPTDHSGLAFTSVANRHSISAFDTITLPTNGSLVAKYASSDNSFSCSFIDRWLIAIRLS